MDTDLSHLPRELTGRIREDLTRWHSLCEQYTWDEWVQQDPKTYATIRLGLDMVELVHLLAHEHHRLCGLRQRTTIHSVVAAVSVVWITLLCGVVIALLGVHATTLPR